MDREVKCKSALNVFTYNYRDVFTIYRRKEKKTKSQKQREGIDRLI
jgi:hypothetical protein